MAARKKTLLNSSRARETAGQPRPMTSIFGRCSAFKTRPEVSKPLRDRLFEVQPVTMSYYSRTGTLCNRFCISSSSFWVARSLLRTRFSLRSLSLRPWIARGSRARTDHAWSLYLYLYLTPYSLPFSKNFLHLSPEKRKGLSRYGTRERETNNGH